MSLLFLSLPAIAPAQSLQVEDCNSNGIDDALDVLPAHFGFDDQVLYATGRGVFRLSALDWTGTPVDFNNDGYPDLVVSNVRSNTISILLNRGDGTFNHLPFKSSHGPTALGLADFDGDGLTDIVTRQWRIKSYGFFFHRGLGGGRFAPTREYSLKEGSSRMHVADFNGDGHPDLAMTFFTTGSERSIAVFLNTPSGFEIQPMFGPTLNSGLDLTSGDFDNDGDVDLVVLRFPFPAAVVFNNRGDGTFLPGVDYKLTFEQANIVPDGVIAADLDNDGDLDLAVSVWADESRGWGDLRILENRGNGTFRSYVDSFEEYGPMRYQIVGLANDLIAGDFDNDGLLDIAMSATDYRGSNVVIMRNQGNLQFGPPAYFPVMHRPLTITAADFNLDGILDLATANFEDSDTVSVLIGQTTAPPFSNDCNFNGVPDECDVAGDSSTDNNENGVPDECERCIGDYNLSGFVDWVDANGHPQFYGCEVGVGLWWCDEADIDGDGQVNPADVGAIRANYGVCP